MQTDETGCTFYVHFVLGLCSFVFGLAFSVPTNNIIRQRLFSVFEYVGIYTTLCYFIFGRQEGHPAHKN